MKARIEKIARTALFVAILPAVSNMMNVPRLDAQPAAVIMAAPSGPKFEVASIEPARNTGAGPPANAGIRIDRSRVDIGFWSIRQLIERAYGIAGYQLSAPEWTADLRFDVAAKFPDGAGKDRLPEMLQWLLADRFGLVAHVEKRELPGFALAIGKSGLKIKPAARGADVPGTASPSRLARVGEILDGLSSYDKPFGLVSFQPMPGVLRAEFQRMPLEALAQILADRLNAPVIDRTGLDGEYQMTLDLPAPGSGTQPSQELEPVGASLSAMVERLGLKLEKRKVAISMLVVDRVNRAPTAN